VLKTLKIHFKRKRPLTSKKLRDVNIPFKIDELYFLFKKVAFFYKDGKEYVTSNEFKTVFFSGQNWSPVEQ
jgi:hypothetical protein